MSARHIQEDTFEWILDIGSLVFRLEIDTRASFDISRIAPDVEDTHPSGGAPSLCLTEDAHHTCLDTAHAYPRISLPYACGSVLTRQSQIPRKVRRLDRISCSSWDVLCKSCDENRDLGTKLSRRKTRIERLEEGTHSLRVQRADFLDISYRIPIDRCDRTHYQWRVEHHPGTQIGADTMF